MAKIKYINKDLDKDLRKREKSAHIGNPIETYRDAKLRTPATSLIKMSVLNNFCLNLNSKQKGSLRILDIGCGNGDNGILLCDELQKQGVTEIVLIQCDASGELLEKAGELFKERFKKHRKIKQELYQLDFRSDKSLETLLELMDKRAHIMFSIKFLHNVPIKINKNISAFISQALVKDGVFMLQSYQNRFKTSLRNIKEYFMGQDYLNSAPIDMYFGHKYLKKHDVKPVYSVISRELDPSLGHNHFGRHAVETYWMKI